MLARYREEKNRKHPKLLHVLRTNETAKSKGKLLRLDIAYTISKTIGYKKQVPASIEAGQIEKRTNVKLYDTREKSRQHIDDTLRNLEKRRERKKKRTRKRLQVIKR